MIFNEMNVELIITKVSNGYIVNRGEQICVSKSLEELTQLLSGDFVKVLCLQQGKKLKLTVITSETN